MRQSERFSLVGLSMLVLVLATALTVSLVGQVGAVELPPRTGERINLFVPPATMPANMAFWFGHGWCTEETDEDPILVALDPESRVEFTIDGVPVVTATDIEFDGTTELGDPCVVEKINYHNARFGLPDGLHAVSGCWFLLGELQFCREAEITFE
jgi:hypothetical protein